MNWYSSCWRSEMTCHKSQERIWVISWEYEFWQPSRRCPDYYSEQHLNCSVVISYVRCFLFFISPPSPPSSEPFCFWRADFSRTESYLVFRSPGICSSRVWLKRRDLSSRSSQSLSPSAHTYGHSLTKVLLRVFPFDLSVQSDHAWMKLVEEDSLVEPGWDPVVPEWQWLSPAVVGSVNPHWTPCLII